MPQKGNYGIDAPIVPIIYFVVALLIIPGIYFTIQRDSWAHWLLGDGAGALILGSVYMHTTLRGKFKIWQNIFDQLLIPEDSKILDLGCGRGAVLIMAAKKLGGSGKAVGVDLWRRVDQSGNDISTTKQNAEIEGVANRIELKTADITVLSFKSNSFDYVVSSLAIHNIKGKHKRKKAITEACRVLKREGTLILADIRHAKEYVSVLESTGMKNIETKGAGWNGWWTGPWLPTKIIIADKRKTK
jgi:cyclopropane fatty-acyl-phospholipid synthase-like methyltransferase